ncbi:hypothetical protein [Bradyrhizobium jicamae]|uniref:hypothetical protein n=1 Tax=Bradyrhizobium jicamae TaxID=280332 RepID=UPI001BA64B37|nr:hypothetical protein [Bradyrhizobium jicamae]MBR0936985.1 hypothetical protein [Bradyrhizobium jicamae]
MTLSVRFYLFADDTVYRISQRLMQRLIDGRDAMPQHAGTKQKVTDVILELNNGKPARIVRAEGNFLTFDEKGRVHKDVVASAFAAMETYEALERAAEKPADKVVDITAKLNREKWERENWWTLSKENLDLIADDVWKRRRIAEAKVQPAQGVEPKPPTITHEAKEAIRLIQDEVMRINFKIEPQTEATLKGIAFEARRRSREDFDNPVWRGVAESADQRREILARYRTGSGIWYAYVELTRWDLARHEGESFGMFHERCNSKKEAEEAARRLLTEHAKDFSVEVGVEARVVSELEWEGDR